MMATVLRVIVAILLAGATVWGCGTLVLAEGAQLPRECVQVADAIACTPPGSSGPPAIVCWAPDAEDRSKAPWANLPRGARLCGFVLMEEDETSRR